MSGIKIGMRRLVRQIYPLKRKKINPISKKRKGQMPEYRAVVKKLRTLCNNRSELSGEKPDWRYGYKVEPHHIYGREGSKLTDPFNIIMITSSEHDEQDGNTYEEKQALLAFVRSVRLKQGFELQVG